MKCNDSLAATNINITLTNGIHTLRITSALYIEPTHRIPIDPSPLFQIYLAHPPLPPSHGTQYKFEI